MSPHTDPGELLPCKLCGNLPGQKVGPPALARCINKECEGSKLGADTLVEWNARQAASHGSAVGDLPGHPTDAMLDAARDWSIAKYGKSIGNDGAIGCWQAMLAALSRPSTGREAETSLQNPQTSPERPDHAQASVWSASTHDEIIKRLMAGVGMPNSTSLYVAFKQFANELHALSLPSASRGTP